MDCDWAVKTISVNQKKINSHTPPLNWKKIEIRCYYMKLKGILKMADFYTFVWTIIQTINTD